jgi:hypothetical protein
MTDIEYAKFILADTAQHLVHAAGIYAVALTAYWLLVA